MKVAIIGGGLQGVETAYLAAKAGWQVTVIDRRADAPAAGICRPFYQMEVDHDPKLDRIFQEADLVLPALENAAALAVLVRLAQRTATPLAFDPEAYRITCSKWASNRLFKRLALGMPADGAHQQGPVIVKPGRGSGSSGVRLFPSLRQARERFLDKVREEDWICQAFVPGPSYSLEVLGMPGCYDVLQVTQLFMDAAFDCKRVTAPADLPPPLAEEFDRIALALAEALCLRGLMDVEVVLHDNRLKLLEIDARIPSQTPTAVYWSCGVNMIEMLGRLFTEGRLPSHIELTPKRAVVYEHICVGPDRITTTGEHIMAAAGPLSLRRDFFGCDEALTNRGATEDPWVATLICSGESRDAAWQKRCSVIARIGEETGIRSQADPSPDLSLMEETP